MSRRLMWEVHPEHEGATGYYVPAGDVHDAIVALIGEWENGSPLRSVIERLEKLVVLDWDAVPSSQGSRS